LTIKHTKVDKNLMAITNSVGTVNLVFWAVVASSLMADDTRK